MATVRQDARRSLLWLHQPSVHDGHAAFVNAVIFMATLCVYADRIVVDSGYSHTFPTRGLICFVELMAASWSHLMHMKREHEDVFNGDEVSCSSQRSFRRLCVCSLDSLTSLARTVIVIISLSDYIAHRDDLGRFWLFIVDYTMYCVHELGGGLFLTLLKSRFAHGSSSVRDALMPLLSAPPIVTMTAVCSHKSNQHGRIATIVTHHATEYLTKGAWRDITVMPAVCSGVHLVAVTVLVRLDCELADERARFIDNHRHDIHQDISVGVHVRGLCDRTVWRGVWNQQRSVSLVYGFSLFVVFLCAFPARMLLNAQTSELVLVVKKQVLDIGCSLSEGWKPWGSNFLPIGDEGITGWTFQPSPACPVTCNALPPDDSGCIWISCTSMSGTEIATFRSQPGEPSHGMWIMDALEHETHSRNYDLVDPMGRIFSQQTLVETEMPPAPIPNLTLLDFATEWSETKPRLCARVTACFIALNAILASLTTWSRGVSLACWLLFGFVAGLEVLTIRSFARRRFKWSSDTSYCISFLFVMVTLIAISCFIFASLWLAVTWDLQHDPRPAVALQELSAARVKYSWSIYLSDGYVDVNATVARYRSCQVHREPEHPCYYIYAAPIYDNLSQVSCGVACARAWAVGQIPPKEVHCARCGGICGFAANRLFDMEFIQRFKGEIHDATNSTMRDPPLVFIADPARYLAGSEFAICFGSILLVPLLFVFCCIGRAPLQDRRIQHACRPIPRKDDSAWDSLSECQALLQDPTYEGGERKFLHLGHDVFLF